MNKRDVKQPCGPLRFPSSGTGKTTFFDVLGFLKDAFDGTIKMVAYLVLLYDPTPRPFLCVEEPENQLYPKLL